MARLSYVDTETISLEPGPDVIYEVGLIVREGGEDRSHHWWLPVDLGRADPQSLDIGRFHDRHPWGDWNMKVSMDREIEFGKATLLSDPVAFCLEFSRLTAGTHLVGAVVSFDEERLRLMLRAHGATPRWHYHLVDVEALIAGRFRMKPPWDSNELSRKCGIDPSKYDRHTALGDAEWVRDLYDSVMNGETE